MLHRTFLLLALLCCALPAYTQQPSGTRPAKCGTPPYTDPWLLEYFERPELQVANRSADTLFVGIQVHLLARDNGTGRFSTERLLDAFCRLNQDYEAAGIHFFLKYDWNLIDSTPWYDHNELEQGLEMMFANNVPDALNCYFVSDPAGNCGYNIPYAGIALNHSCSGPNEHTWAHEVGHALTLQHPFIGWEGKIYNFNTPTPETLTYDYTHFHAQPDTIVPAPLDTALVEYADMSNCTLAADKFCDTPPDYLSYIWDCDAQGKSLTKQKDPAGNEFYSDGTLFMSYSSDVCANRFSTEEIAAMRANLISTKQVWMNGAPAPQTVDGLAAPASPVNGQFTPPSNVTLQWPPVPGATHYLVQVSRFNNFLNKEFDVVTTDTAFLCAQLVANKTYYWRVRPFNYQSTCAGFCPAASFKTTESSAILPTPSETHIRAYPTVLQYGQELSLELPDTWLNREVQCTIYDGLGRPLKRSIQTFGYAYTRLQWPTEARYPGIYYLVLRTGDLEQSFPIWLQPG